MSRAGRRRRAPACQRSLSASHEGFIEVTEAVAEGADPKSSPLCAEARRALEFAFAAECRDEALAGLVVLSVTPDPTVRRLRVWLKGPQMEKDEREHVLVRLAAARGFLRSRVAAGIHRKRTPELSFELLADAPDVLEDGG